MRLPSAGKFGDFELAVLAAHEVDQVLRCPVLRNRCATEGAGKPMKSPALTAILHAVDERDGRSRQHVDPLLFVVMRVVDEGFLARRHADEVHAGAFQTDAARQLRAAHQRVRIPGMGEFLRVRGDVGGAHDVEAGLVHARNLTRSAASRVSRGAPRVEAMRERSRQTAAAAVEDIVRRRDRRRSARRARPSIEWNRLSCDSGRARLAAQAALR